MPSVDFASWNTGNLVRFAQEAQAKMDAQDKQIAQLQDDLRVAIDAYRVLINRQSKDTHGHHP
jgi:hypothetical protein